MASKTIPIWLVEYEVGGGLPTERVYHHSATGEPIGYVVMPEGMGCCRLGDHIRLEKTADGFRHRHAEHVASLSTRRVVEAAIEGEFGLSWQSADVKASGPSPAARDRVHDTRRGDRDAEDPE